MQLQACLCEVGGGVCVCSFALSAAEKNGGISCKASEKADFRVTYHTNLGYEGLFSSHPQQCFVLKCNFLHLKLKPFIWFNWIGFILCLLSVRVCGVFCLRNGHYPSALVLRVIPSLINRGNQWTPTVSVSIYQYLISTTSISHWEQLKHQELLVLGCSSNMYLHKTIFCRLFIFGLAQKCMKSEPREMFSVYMLS